METGTRKRAAIYVREPARAMRDRIDAREQVEETVDYCREMDLDVVARYEDEAGSREAFRRMMEDATGGEAPFDFVVVSKSVYFAVQVEEAILEGNRLKANGVEVLSVREKRVPEDQHPGSGGENQEIGKSPQHDRNPATGSMQTTDYSDAASNARYASTVLVKTADIIDRASRKSDPWTLDDTLRQATSEYDREAAAGTKRRYGVIPLVKAVGRYLEDHAGIQREPDEREETLARRWCDSTDAEKVAATLRNAAPAIAEEVRTQTAQQEAALEKLDAANLSEKEVLELVREVRAERMGRRSCES